MALLIISVLICALSIAGFIYHFVNFKRDRKLDLLNKKTLTEFISCIALFAIFSTLTAIGIVLFNKFPLDAGHYALTIIGSFLFGISFFVLFETFVIYYYKVDIDKKLRKIIRIIFYVSIALTIIFLMMSIEGYAPYLTTPYTIGIHFSSKGVHIIRTRESGGFFIAWYGIIILSGAIMAYFAADHEFYKEYKRHGLIDTLFVLAFIMGIIGARFWYVFVLEKNPSIFFNFSDGGLAIMGGVLFGSVSGVIFILVFRRYMNIRHAMDMLVPCLLIAQAVGRWGNFFNKEVYGYMTFAPSSCWWLPTFIRQQMIMSDGLVHLPLFLIEFLTNLSGYFIIRYAIGIGLKKHLSYGDLTFTYISWYGLTRVILEPLRQSDFEYGESFITACIMLGGGILGIISLHVYDYLRWGKHTFNFSLNENDSKYNHKGNPYLVKASEIND